MDPKNKLPGTSFFPNGKLNYAENMLEKNTMIQLLLFSQKTK